MTNRSEITYLTSRFPDENKAREMLGDWSPRQVRRFNAFMNHGVTGIMLDSWRYGSNTVNQRMGETVVRLFKGSKRFTRKGWKDENFLLCVERVIHADTIDEFEKLDKNIQHQLWKNFYSGKIYNPLQSCADKAYMRLLHKTGLSVDQLYSIQSKLADDEDLTLPFQSSVEIEHGVDLSNPTPAFTQILMRQPSNSHQQSPSLRKFFSRSESFEPYGVHIILMLRAIYGEEKVIDLFQHFEKSNQFLCPNESIDLLTDWETLRSYPVDWIAQMRNLKH